MDAMKVIERFLRKVVRQWYVFCSIKYRSEYSNDGEFFYKSLTSNHEYYHRCNYYNRRILMSLVKKTDAKCLYGETFICNQSGPFCSIHVPKCFYQKTCTLDPCNGCLNMSCDYCAQGCTC
jgi:hypothetical protein